MHASCDAHNFLYFWDTAGMVIQNNNCKEKGNKNLFNSYFKRKNGKVFSFDIVHFPNFEISASL